MDLFEAITKRHSYRGAFLETPVPREHLTRIVEAGLKAPSGKNCQTTTFVIVDEPALVRDIGAMNKNSKAMQTAGAFIACIVNDPHVPVVGDISFEIEDCSAAVENILLATTAMGYATVWIDGWLRGEDRAEKIGRLLKLPAGKKIRIILPIGVPAEQAAPPPKKPFSSRAWYNSYGG